jgi:hypothetical protein
MSRNLTKTITSLLVAATMLISFNLSFASSSQTDLEKAKKNMLNMGLSQECINDMLESDILQYLSAKVVLKNEEYYRVDSTIEVNAETKKEKVASSKKVKISKDEAIRGAVAENQKSTKKYINELLKSPSGTDIVRAAGFGSSSNSSQPYVVSAYLKFEIWATYLSGNTYQVSTRFEWLSYPSEQNVEDVLAISIDTKATKVQNTGYFVASYDEYTCYSNGTQVKTSTGTQIKYSTTPTKEEVSGSGYTYIIPPKINPGTTQYWYEKRALRGYMNYNIFVPNTKPASYGVLASYAHEKAYRQWLPAYFSVSFPAGISFTPSQPAGFASNVTTTSLYTNFYVN